MAKKIVNVSYKVDDSELQKAKVTIQQVAAETKKSEVAMTQLSAQTTKSGTQIANTYEGMKLQMQQLRAQIDLTRNSDTARLSKLKGDYQEVKQRVDDFNKSLEKTKEAGQSNLSIFNSLQTTLVAVFSVAFVKQIGAAYLEMNKLAGQVQGVDLAFKRAFPNATLLLDKLRASTHGTVTDFELMKRTLQATNLGVNVEHLGVLFEFAAARAQQTGESVDYLVDSIVRGIGRKSILVLDNLGLSATRLREQFNGASIASKSVAEVTEGVAAIAKVELEKMGGYVETSATKVDQLHVAWDTLKQAIAKGAEDAGVIGFFTSLIDRITNSIAPTEALAKTAAKTVNEFLSTGKKTNKQIQDEIILRSQNRDSLEAELAAWKKNNDTTTPGVLTKIKILEDEIKVEKEAITILSDYNKKLAETKPPAQESVGIIQALTDKIGDLNEALKKAATQNQISKIIKDLKAAETELKNVQLPRLADPTDAENAKRDAEHDANDLAYIMAEVQDEVIKNTDDFNKKTEDAEKEHQKELKKIDADAEAERKAQSDRERESAIKEIEKHNRDKERLQQAFQNFILNSVDQILTATLINRRDDTDSINAYYDNQVAAAGKNDAQIKNIEKKRADALDKERIRQQEADKEAAITKIEIDALVAAARQFVDYPWPIALGFAAIIAASAAVQIATIKSIKTQTLKTRAFAEGEVGIDGPGTSTSDSIPAWLSKGESVINANATANSRNLLEAINERKIDDRILGKLAGDGGRQDKGFDDKGIIEAIEKSRVDYAIQGATIMEGRTKGKNFKQYIRSKVQGYR